MYKSYAILIGCSAGGIQALQSLIAPFPAEFPAAILIVMHVHSICRLDQIISRYSKIPVNKNRERISNY
ncbi:chemotaxis protein CheB [Legionella sp. WA2022007384]